MRVVAVTFAAVLVMAVVLAGCGSSGPGGPSPTVASSTSFVPVRVTVAPPPSAAWTTARTCPTETAAKAAFGAQTLAQRTNADVDGVGCVYRIAPQTSIDVTVIEGTVDTNRGIWTRPPADVVRDAPELARGAVLVYTPPGGVDQCLVAVDHPRGTLAVQVTRRDTVDRRTLCAPLGPMLRLLAAR